jgi:hypothetical protein
MENEKERLVLEYNKVEEEIVQLKEKRKSVLKELSLLDGHKVGEIVKWVETNRTKNEGWTLNPRYVPLPDKEHIAVLTNIDVTVSWNGFVRYTHTFRPINKDGSISKNNCYVSEREIEWTGEIHKDYQDK